MRFPVRPSLDHACGNFSKTALDRIVNISKKQKQNCCLPHKGSREAQGGQHSCAKLLLSSCCDHFDADNLSPSCLDPLCAAPYLFAKYTWDIWWTYTSFAVMWPAPPLGVRRPLFFKTLRHTVETCSLDALALCSHTFVQYISMYVLFKVILACFKFSKNTKCNVVYLAFLAN